MIQSYINTITPLTSNTDSVAFQTDCIRTRSSTCCGWLNHSQGSPNYEVLSDGKTNAMYEINFDATVSSATAGVVAFGIYKDGVLMPGTLMAVTLDAADDYENVSMNKKFIVCCRGNADIDVRSVPAVATPTTPTTPVETEIPIIVSANLSLNRLS